MWGAQLLLEENTHLQPGSPRTRHPPPAREASAVAGAVVRFRAGSELTWRMAEVRWGVYSEAWGRRRRKGKQGEAEEEGKEWRVSAELSSTAVVCLAGEARWMVIAEILLGYRSSVFGALGPSLV